MSRTITNVGQLQKALQTLSIPNVENESTHTQEKNNTEPKNDHKEFTSKSNSKLRTDASQFSGNTLLYNIAGLQTTTNSKLDLLIDSTLRLHNTMEKLLVEQQKQTEILASISRNTMNYPQTNTVSSNSSSVSKLNKMGVKDYGFNNPIGVAAELIMKILKEVEIQVKHRGIKYRSTRSLTRQMLEQAIKTACSGEFKHPELANKQIKLPENKDPTTIKVASRIGTVNDINPTLTARAIRELFDDSDTRTFMSGIEEVVERLKVIRVVIPYYEADMINAINYPYFDKEGSIICDWSKLSSRMETNDEATVIMLPAQKREKLGQCIARGVSLKAAIQAIVK